MRKFYIEVATNENWEKLHRVIIIKAHTLNRVFKRLRKRISPDEDIYQICTMINGFELPQPIWDFLNGKISKKHGLKI